MQQIMQTVDLSACNGAFGYNRSCIMLSKGAIPHTLGTNFPFLPLFRFYTHSTFFYSLGLFSVSFPGVLSSKFGKRVWVLYLCQWVLREAPAAVVDFVLWDILGLDNTFESKPTTRCYI